MGNIKVSVIIPTYKRSADICRAVDSVLNQTMIECEAIVVDDNGVGTNEGNATALVMKKYEGNSRVVYLQHEVNKNGSAARNTGIRAAKGEYLAFLDDDDAYLPERLQKMCEKMDSLDESWGSCYTGYVKHQANGTNQYSAEKVEGDIFVQTLMRSFYIGTGSNLFFRRSVIDDIGLFDESFKRNQDLEYLVRVLKKYKMAYVDEVLMEAFYDIRTIHLSLDESIDREKLFREKFSPFLSNLDCKQQREIQIMWDIDWIRILIGRKEYSMAIKKYFEAKIPIRVLVAYGKYALDRKRNNTSYGFVVRL